MTQEVIGQKNLSDLLVMSVESHAIFVHENALADGGAGLAFLNIVDFCGDAQSPGPHAERTGSYQNDLSPLPDKLRNLLGDHTQKIRVHPPLLAQHMGSDFDHNPFGITKVTHDLNIALKYNYFEKFHTSLIKK